MNAKNGKPGPRFPLRQLLGSEHVDVVGIFLRRWPLVVLGFLTGIGLSIAYLFVATTRYESSAQILVMKKDANLPARGVEGSNERSSEVSEDLLATHMQIVQSPQIVRAALVKHNLEGLPSISSRVGADESEVDYVIDRMKVSRGGTGQARLANVLNVAFKHVSDQDCERVLSAVVESYQEFLAEKFQDVSKEAVKLISEAKDQIGKDLETAEADYQRFREAAPMLWNGESSSNTHRLNFERLQVDMAGLDVSRSAAKTRLEIVERAIAKRNGAIDDVDLLALIDDAHVARLTLLVEVKRGASDTEEFQSLLPGLTANTRAEYEAVLPLSLKERTLISDYGPDHPLVKDVREHIQATEKFVTTKQAGLHTPEVRMRLNATTVVNGYVSLLKNDLETLDLRQSDLQRLAAKEEEGSKELVATELQGESLHTAVLRKQALYDAVIDRLRELNLVGAYGKLITEVIAPVELGEKVWPKQHWVLLIGVMAGLVLGLGAAVGAEQLDRSFHNEGELRQTLNLPVLTRVSKLKSVELHPADLESDIDSSLVAFHRPKSREAEAFRGLRTALFFGSRGQRQQILMGTSANPGDGKTLLNSNLAVSIAQSGRKVLLVNADMRRPRIHKVLGVSNDVGLSAVIRGDIDPPDAVQATAIENLWCVPCGVSPSNPAELLTASRFEECLQCYREQYDFIIIDCPPVLAVADPCIIAPLADAVVMAVRLLKDTRSQVLRAKELLDGVDANIIGLFVNGVDNTGAGYGQYGSGRYGYGGSGYGYGTYGYGAQSSGGYYDDEAPSKNGSSNGSSNGNGHAKAADNSTNGNVE